MIEIDLGVFRGVLEGDESAQDIASGIGGIFSDAYWTARDATADFYASIADGWNFAAGCGQYY
jgi:hypothetical protein